VRKHKLYKHENSIDLVIEPVRIIWLKNPERLKVKALLYTTGYPGKLYFMDKDEWIILKEDYNKWKLYDRV
jgi:hypothetical protein